MSILEDVNNLFHLENKLAIKSFSASLRRYTICRLIAVTLILAWLVSGTANCKRPGESKPKPTLLRTGTQHTRELVDKQFHEYQLELNSKDYAKLSITGTGLPILTTVYSPGKQILSRYTCYTNQPISLSIIAQESGIYSIQTQLEGDNNFPGAVSLAVELIRASTADDIYHIQAENLVAEAESLLWKQEPEDKQIVRRKLEESLMIWRRLGEKSEEAKTLRAIGLVYLQREEYESALDQYNKALYLVSGTETVLKCDLLNKISQAEALLDRSDDSVQHADAALKLANTLNYLPGKARAWDSNGLTSHQKGENLAALEFYQKALQIWEQLGFPRELANTHAELVSIYADLSDLGNASAHFQQAIRFGQIVNDNVGEARVTIIMGNMYSMLGEKQEAKNLYRSAQDRLRNIKNKEAQAQLYAGLAFFLKGIGDYEGALEYYQQTQQIRQEFRQEIEEAGMWIVIGNTYRSMGQIEAAADSYQKALALLQGKKELRFLAHALKGLGVIQFSLQNYNKAMSYYLRAVNCHRSINNLRGEADILNELGNIEFEKKRYHQAQLYYSQALSLNRRTGARLETTQTLYYLAKVEMKLRRPIISLQFIQEAIDIIETLRAKIVSLQNRIAYFSTVRQCYDLYIDVTVELSLKYPKERFLLESFAISEKSRARGLLEWLNEAKFLIEQGVDPKLLQDEKLLLQEANRLAEQEMQLRGARAQDTEVLEINKKIKAVMSQLNELQERIRLSNSKVATLTQANPLGVDRIQQLLDDDTMLLQYSLTSERSFLWAITHDSINAYVLPKRATIENLVREVYALMIAPQKREGETPQQSLLRVKQANQQYWLKASELSQILLTPLSDKLGRKRLIIVGEGALQWIPFAALPDPVVGRRLSVVGKKVRLNQQPATDELPPLIVNHEITYLPSASILSVLRKERASQQVAPTRFASLMNSFREFFGQPHAGPPSTLDSVAILADPVFEKDDNRLQKEAERNALTTGSSLQLRDMDLSDENLHLNRLRETSAEAGEIEKAAGANAFLLKTGFAVNRALLESEELNRYGIIHFATHGYWDSERPELSGLVLSRYDSQGRKQDGFLRLSDIYNLRMPKDLVVLSACETAIGKDIRGEGLMALTRGFMYAGAARVIASLWKVEESATVDLMKVFYSKLLREKRTPAAALREAQIAMWRQDPTSAPYDWAAFVLQGEYR